MHWTGPLVFCFSSFPMLLEHLGTIVLLTEVIVAFSLFVAENKVIHSSGRWFFLS